MCTVSLVKITSCLVLKREYVCLTSPALREGLCREWRPDRAFSCSKQPSSHSGGPEAQQNHRAGGQPGLCSHCQAPSCCDPRLPATAPAAVGASWSWKGQLAAGGRPFPFFFLLACVSVGPLGKYLFRRAVSSAVSWSPANRQAVSPRGNLCYLSGRWRSCVGYQCSGEYNPVLKQWHDPTVRIRKFNLDFFSEASRQKYSRNYWGSSNSAAKVKSPTVWYQ